MVDPRISLELGSLRLVVDTKDITWEKRAKLKEAIFEIRKSESLLATHPMLEGEDQDAWLERIGPDLQKEKVRKEGESEEDHIRRLLNPEDEDSFEYTLKVLNSICSIYGLKKEVTEPDLMGGSVNKVKEFIFNILNLSNIKADEFFPKRQI